MSLRQRIETDTRALALPRGRKVGTPGHDVARKYLTGRMTAIGLQPFRGTSFELPFVRPHPETGEMTSFANLIGVIPGRQSAETPLLIGAHYDSVIDAPCADDNAASVAVVLAAAERFAASPLKNDLIVAIFDSEEPPYFLGETMGSKRFVEDHCSGLSFACAIILDLIAHDVVSNFPHIDSLIPGLAELIFVMGSESGRGLQQVVERAAADVSGLRVLPTLNSYIGDMSDHHAFRTRGQRYLFLSCGQGRYYHRPEDDMEWINLDKTARVAELVVKLLNAADDLDAARTAAEHDTAEFEIRMIRRALGDSLPGLLAALGIKTLSTRADLNVFVSALALKMTH